MWTAKIGLLENTEWRKRIWGRRMDCCKIIKMYATPSMRFQETSSGVIDCCAFQTSLFLNIDHLLCDSSGRCSGVIDCCAFLEAS